LFDAFSMLDHLPGPAPGRAEILPQNSLLGSPAVTIFPSWFLTNLSPFRIAEDGDSFFFGLRELIRRAGNV
jgi:hypothetical protein